MLRRPGATVCDRQRAGGPWTWTTACAILLVERDSARTPPARRIALSRERACVAQLIVRILELWLTPSGAVVTCSLVILVLGLCAFFSARAQGLSREFISKGFRGRWGKGEIEIGASPTPRPEMTGDVPPVEPGKPEATTLARAPARETEDAKDEFALTIEMHMAALDRDAILFEEIYNKLKHLHNRQITDEDLTSFKLELEYEMGNQSVLKNLETLTSDQPRWYEPCYRLAAIYTQSEQYDLASKWLDEAVKRSRNELELFRIISLRKTILSNAQGAESAQRFLFEHIADFKETANISSMWDLIADTYKALGDEPRSLMALEKAVRLDPVDRYRRFRLAYRYADNKMLKSLAFFHYNRLISQDERHPNALNNLGLLISDLGMPGNGVDMLKKAKRFEEPYPHGNLAIRLAGAGFFDEGVQILEELAPERRVQTRAADAAEFIRRRRTEEANRLEKLTAASEVVHKVYSKAADALGAAVGIGSAVGEWKGSSGERLSLNDSAEGDWLVGTLVAGGSERQVRLRKVESLLTGTATSKTWSVLTPAEEQMILVLENDRIMEGIIATDEVSVRKVSFERGS
jgi:tetratricopeptide (TPR) repeat protein